MIRNNPVIIKKWSMNTSLCKEELTRILVWVKIHDVPIQVFSEDGLSIIASQIGKPIMLDSYTSSMCMESWGRSSFVQCLIEINVEDVLKESLTMGVPLIEGTGFIIETATIEYEWKPPRCDLCKIFGHVHDHCPRKFGGHSVKQIVRYEPKVTANVPKKGATNLGNASKSSSMLKKLPLKAIVPPTKEGNITMSNSYAELDDESEEDVQNVYDESTNLLTSTKTGESSSTFMVDAAKRSLPFFDTLKDMTKENKDKYRWTEDAEKAFQEIKKVIVELPLLTTPRKEEMLYVYLAAVEEAVSAVLLTERNEKQCLIHHVSRTLNKAEKNYAPLEKLAMSLLHMSRRLQRAQNKDDAEKWTLFTDGASNSKGSGAGLVLISPSGTEFTYALCLNFTSTNNDEEYEALLAGLRMAAKIKLQVIDVKVDSKLVASQINGNYVASSTNMIKYLAMTRECIAGFKSFAIQNIPCRILVI
ncbi:zinc knuckle CX2CX4HX4C containing protein [Tanacetum coccineum]